MSTLPATVWPEGVIARYLTAAGSVDPAATVDVSTRPGYHGVKHDTEHFVICRGCGETHSEDWGWDAYHDEFRTGPQPDFDATGKSAEPAALKWAQAHAERCRALPRPA